MYIFIYTYICIRCAQYFRRRHSHPAQFRPQPGVLRRDVPLTRLVKHVAGQILRSKVATFDQDSATPRQEWPHAARGVQPSADSPSSRNSSNKSLPVSLT